MGLFFIEIVVTNRIDVGTEMFILIKGYLE